MDTNANFQGSVGISNSSYSGILPTMFPTEVSSMSAIVSCTPNDMACICGDIEVTGGTLRCGLCRKHQHLSVLPFPFSVKHGGLIDHKTQGVHD